MKIAADTNVLLRLILADDEAQGRAALDATESADRVAISVHSLCELVWVLSTRAAMPRPDIASAIRSLIDARHVVVDRPAVEAGLALFDAGGDFADGVIAFEGQWLGGGTFVSFDKTAVALLARQGIGAKHL